MTKLTFAEKRVLDILKKHPGLRSREVADMLYPRSNQETLVSKLMNSLEAKGLINRDNKVV